MKKRLFNTFKDKYGFWILFVLVILVALINFRAGYFILGNDNYSPEVVPTISVDRFIKSPAWRSYRALGVASDADQADIWRSILFYLLGRYVPTWFLSQFFIFSSMAVGIFSVGALGVKIMKWLGIQNSSELIRLTAGILYMTNVLFIWIFYSPLIPFLTVWAFLPLLLLQASYVLDSTWKYKWIGLAVALVLITSTGIVPTIFIVQTGLIFVWLMVLGIKNKKKSLAFFVFIAYLISQSFWLLPFIWYVKTNSSALQMSFINRKLTPEMIENEVANNTFFSVPRYVASWLNIKNDDGSWWYSFATWFGQTWVIVMSFLPPILAVIGVVLGFIKKQAYALFLSMLFFSGWFLIKGLNPPLGLVYVFLQEKIPLFEQVFRWQSSKIWPFLAMSMPFLATYAIFHTGRAKKIFIFLVIIFGLVIIGPAWKGGLIRDGNFVKIPQEYENLRQFLTKNEMEKERIFLAPEANTLYFRNYSWGFFGSSILNYLLPNPIIEKAMTTGSMESEDAQDLLEQAVHANSKEYFAKLLSRYKTPLVLLDKNASSRTNGYRYDWDIINNAIEANSDLKKIWTSGNLELFSLENFSRNQNEDVEIVDNNLDWKKLNLIKSLTQNDNKQYWSGENTAGTIYPFAWNYKDVHFDSKQIVLSGEYAGLDQTFYYRAGENIEDDEVYELHVNNVDNRIVSVTAMSPSLRVGENIYSLGAEVSKNIAFKDQPKYINIAGEIFPLNTEPKLKFKLADLQDKNKMFFLGGSFVASETEMPSTGQPYWIAKSSGVVEVDLYTDLQQPEQLSWCPWSELEHRCLSENMVGNFSAGLQKITVLIPQYVEAGDKLTFYLNRVGADKANKLTNISIREYSQVLDAMVPNILGEKNQEIRLNKGDKFELILPRLSSPAWSLFDDKLEPEFSQPVCNGKDFKSDITSINGRQMIFNFKNCWGGIYSKIHSIYPNGQVGLIFYKSQNQLGIPLDILLKGDKDNYPYVDIRTGYKKSDFSMELVVLPEVEKSYNLAVAANGISWRPSVNTLSLLELNFVPKSWLNIALVPSLTQPKKVIGINESVSPLWLSNLTNPVRINGWEQGWIQDQAALEKVVYKSNYLAWLGYGMATLLYFCLLLMSLIGQVKYKKKYQKRN